jgi:hypothetical protein
MDNDSASDGGTRPLSQIAQLKTVGYEQAPKTDRKSSPHFCVKKFVSKNAMHQSLYWLCGFLDFSAWPSAAAT